MYEQKLINFTIFLFLFVLCCLLPLRGILVVATEEVAAEATAFLFVVPLVEPASARVLEVIALIDQLVGEAVLAVVEPKANALLLLATLIRTLTPIFYSPRVVATALLSVSLCHTKDILSESSKLPLEGGALLKPL